MKKCVHSSEDIFAMSNVRGKHIKVEPKVPFSFYYSPKNGNHGPRVKPILNPEKLYLDDAGTLKLCDDWEFVPGKQDEHYSSSQLREMKEFFRKYLVLFLLVWDKHISDPELEDYFRRDISLAEFIQDLDFYNDYREELDDVETVAELEQICRNYNLVNFYGN